MIGRRILYFFTLIGCFIFFLAYQEWLSWFLFALLLGYPWFSLAVSLPAMLTTKLQLSLPKTATLGAAVDLRILHRCPLPTPTRKCKLVVERPLTGQRWKLQESDPLPTNHCGTLMISLKKARVLDYAGMFKLPVRFSSKHHQLSVLPVPVPVADLPSLEHCRDLRWKPKPGGGFSENHELRLYRPGDNIQQIHWKLSAKTGNLILREPMEPIRNRILVRMDLSGTPHMLDRKLGQLLWVGQELLSKDIPFQLQCLTGIGKEQWPIACQKDLDQALEILLGRTPTMAGSLRTHGEIASWQYFIGGDGYEA